MQYFYEILSVCTRRQAAFKFLVWSLSGDKQPRYKHFPAVGAFSLKFSIVPSGETTDRIEKKVRGVQKWDGPLSPRQVWWDRGSRAGCRRKSVMFCVCFFVTLWNYEVCDNGNAIEQYNFQNNIMVSLHTGRFVVAHLYSTFFVNPQNVPIGVNLYQKLRIFAILRAVGQQVQSQNSEVWYEGADLGLPPPN